MYTIQLCSANYPICLTLLIIINAVLVSPVCLGQIIHAACIQHNILIYIKFLVNVGFFGKKLIFRILYILAITLYVNKKCYIKFNIGV